MPDGEPAHIANDVLWPTISPDGSQIAYAVQSPDDGSNDLCFSAAVGSNHQRLVEHGLFYAVDAPIRARWTESAFQRRGHTLVRR